MLSRQNYETNIDEEIPGRCITINSIESCTDIPDCMTADKIRMITLDDEHLIILSEHVLHGWPPSKAEAQKELKPYWSFRDDTAIIEGIGMKSRKIIVPASLQCKAMKHT